MRGDIDIFNKINIFNWSPAYLHGSINHKFKIYFLTHKNKAKQKRCLRPIC